MLRAIMYFGNFPFFFIASFKTFVFTILVSALALALKPALNQQMMSQQSHTRCCRQSVIRPAMCHHRSTHFTFSDLIIKMNKRERERWRLGITVQTNCHICPAAKPTMKSVARLTLSRIKLSPSLDRFYGVYRTLSGHSVIVNRTVHMPAFLPPPLPPLPIVVGSRYLLLCGFHIPQLSNFSNYLVRLIIILSDFR